MENNNFKIIDGHAHMLTNSIIKQMKIKPGDSLELRELPRHSVEENVEAWIKAMDKNNVEKTVFMATSSLNKDFINFINSSSRFIGMARINPTMPNAIYILKKEIKAGMSGVKFYATNDAFDVASKKAYPFFNFCQKHNIPIVIHFGVTIGYVSDLRAGNPLCLLKVLRDFPEINFVIAHFGAGFFREVLMLNYKTKNLYLDTSGTNNWLMYQDNFLCLRDVFKKVLQVFGPEKIIFGTDTRIFPKGYRQHILKGQQIVLEQLRLSNKEKENIFYKNAKKIFKI